MSDRNLLLAIGGLVLVGLATLFLGAQRDALPQPVPAPAPCPPDQPCPVKPKRPWQPKQEAPVGAYEVCSNSVSPSPDYRGRQWGASVGGPIAPDGSEIQVDLPGELHRKNSGGMGPGGPGTGSGLCVFTSIEHAAIWQNVTQLNGFQKWMTSKPGGGYPEKVDKMIAEFCAERKLPVPKYLQVQGNDLEILKLALNTGRMPGITYSYSPSGRYGGQRIAHMVNLVHGDGKNWCVLDNNFPGADKYEWMNTQEFVRAYTAGEGWSVILLSPPPPPSPRNR
jgi:hypothetical protein